MTPPTEQVVLNHRGNNFTVTKNGKVAYEGRFTVDVTKMPYEVSPIFSKSTFEWNHGGARIGIALLAGDTLKTLFGPVGPPPRPKRGFQSFPDSETVLTIHQRVGTERGTGPTVSPTGAVAVWWTSPLPSVPLGPAAECTPRRSPSGAPPPALCSAARASPRPHTWLKRSKGVGDGRFQKSLRRISGRSKDSLARVWYFLPPSRRLGLEENRTSA